MKKLVPLTIGRAIAMLKNVQFLHIKKKYIYIYTFTYCYLNEGWLISF